MGALASRDPLGFSQHVCAKNKTQQSKKGFPDLPLEDSPANTLGKQPLRVVIGRVAMMSRFQAASSLRHAEWAEHPFSPIST